MFVYHNFLERAIYKLINTTDWSQCSQGALLGTAPLSAALAWSKLSHLARGDGSGEAQRLHWNLSFALDRYWFGLLSLHIGGPRVVQ